MTVSDDDLRAAAERRHKLEAETDKAVADLRALCLQAIDEGRAKLAVHKLTGVSRNTLDDWLEKRSRG